MDSKLMVIDNRSPVDGLLMKPKIVIDFAILMVSWWVSDPDLLLPDWNASCYEVFYAGVWCWIK